MSESLTDLEPYSGLQQEPFDSVRKDRYGCRDMGLFRSSVALFHHTLESVRRAFEYSRWENKTKRGGNR